MAAAVADFRPRAAAEHKIKKSELDDDAPAIALERTQDILEAVKARRAQTQRPRVVVGFAAESRDLRVYARAKIERKGVDLLVANDISAADAGFDVDTNRVVILDAQGGQLELDLTTKTRVAEILIERIGLLLGTPYDGMPSRS